MTILERAGDIGVSLTTTAFTTLLGGVLWLIRRVVTNQAQIKAVVDTLSARDKLRDEDREAMKELRTDIRDQRAEIRALSERISK